MNLDLYDNSMISRETDRNGISVYCSTVMDYTSFAGTSYDDFGDILDDNFVKLEFLHDYKGLGVIVMAMEGNNNIVKSWVVKVTGFKGGTTSVHNNCVNVGFSSAANQELCGSSMNKTICFGWIMEFLVGYLLGMKEELKLANVCTTLLVNGFLPICCMIGYCVEDIEYFENFGCCLFGGSIELEFTKSIGGEFVSVSKNLVCPLTVKMLLLQQQKRVIITCEGDKKIDNSWDEEFTKFKGGTMDIFFKEGT